MISKTIRTGIVIAGLLGPWFACAGPVNVNTADAATIAAELDGIGMVKAEAIVAFRKANGPFRSADELLAVKGIGERTLAAIRSDVLVATAETGTAEER